MANAPSIVATGKVITDAFGVSRALFDVQNVNLNDGGWTQNFTDLTLTIENSTNTDVISVAGHDITLAAPSSGNFTISMPNTSGGGGNDLNLINWQVVSVAGKIELRFTSLESSHYDSSESDNFFKMFFVGLSYKVVDTAAVQATRTIDVTYLKDDGDTFGQGDDANYTNPDLISTIVKNNVPTISGAATGTVAEDGTLTAGNTLTVTDVDTGQSKFQMPTSLAGTYGTFTFNADTGVWGYTLDNTKGSVQALPAATSVSDTLVVTSFDGTKTQDIVVTIDGKNDEASISGTATGTVAEDGTLTAGNTLTVTDVDTGQSKFQMPTSLAGTYGTFTFNADTGVWGYTLDNTKGSVQALPAATSVSDTLVVTSFDGTKTQDIVVTIDGKNDEASISGTATGTVAEDDTLTAGNTLTVTDVDTGQSKFQMPTSLAGTYGTFTFNADTGVWGYTLDNTKGSVQALPAATSVSDTLVVTSFDGTKTQDIVVTIDGKNDEASISGTATGTVAEDGTLTAGNTLTVTDVDTGQSKFQMPTSLAGTYGTFTFNADTGVWGYTLDNTKGSVQALPAATSVSDTLVVTSFDGTKTQDIVVTIDGKNDEASISGTATGTVAEDGTLTAGNTLTVTDVDTGQSKFQMPTSLAGIYGTFTFNADTGVWGYTLDNTKGSVQALPAATSVSDTLVVTSFDGTKTQDIVVTIDGKNDEASISGTATGTVAEDGTLTAGNTLTVTDVDTGQSKFQMPTSLAGTYGTFTFNADTGVWGYTLDNTKGSVQALPAATSVSDTLVVTSFDGTKTQDIVVTIDGKNDEASISGTATGTVAEDGTLTAGNTLTVTDVDTGQSKFQMPTSLAGIYGTFTFNADTGVWGYTLDNTKGSVQALPAATSVSDTLVVTSFDGTKTQDIVVTIDGKNDEASISGTATGTVAEDGTLTAGNTLTVTDVDTGQSKFQMPTSLAGTYGTFTFNADTGVWGYTLDNSSPLVRALTSSSTPVIDELIVRSFDGTDSETIKVTINGSDGMSTPTNRGPSVLAANADPEGIQAGRTFSLIVGDDHFIDPDGNDLDYTISVNGEAAPSWMTFDAETGTLEGLATTNGVYQIIVTASDGALTASDEFTLVIGAATQPRGTRNNDVMVGDELDNLLNGRKGNDKLTGGDGADTFVFSKGHDKVLDFDAAEGDLIDLGPAKGIKSYNDLVTYHIVDTDAGIKIMADGGSWMLVKGLHQVDLSEDMFAF